MTTVGVGEAKTHLSRLLKQVEAGEEVVIQRGGVPVARIVPVPPRPSSWIGMDRGKFTVPDDFNDPLPELEEFFT